MNDAFTTATTDLPWLRALAVRLAHGDLDIADDVVQQTLERAWQGAPDSTALHSPRGWLATVLRNHLRMTRRSAARRSARDAAGAPITDHRDAPIDELARLELLGLVMDRLKALPEIDRRIVTLRFFEELDANEIGARLSMPAATVRSRLARALAKVREEIDTRHGGDRSAWALVLGVPFPPTDVVVTTTNSTGVLAAMSTATKLGLIVIAGAIGTVAWVAARADPSSEIAESKPGAPTTSPSTAGEVASNNAVASRTESAAAKAWRGRRATIRARLQDPSKPHAPAPPVDHEADQMAMMQQANEVLTTAFDDCTESSTQPINGRMILRATMIGSPDVGTIFETIEPVDEATRDVDLLECVIESSYAYTGPAPSAAAEVTTTMSWLGAQPEKLPDDAWRQEMFDAVIIAFLAELRTCEIEGTRGELVLAFDFTNEPTPTAVRAEGDVPLEVRRCAEAAAIKWRFPRKFNGKTMTHTLTMPIDPAVAGVRDDE